MQARPAIVVLSLGSSLIVAAMVSAQGGIIKNIPGGQTAAGVISATLDGGQQYFAPDGPIQPAITAIGGLPIRATEMANQGISRISSGLGSGARRISEAAGNGGSVNMPGMEAMESMMPASIAQLGGGMRDMIRQKNNMIRSQAEAAISSANRQGEMIRHGFQGMAQNSMGDMSGMMSGAQEAFSKGASTIQHQFKRSIGDTMSRMQSMQGMGQNMRNQAEGLTRTLANGVTGSLGHLQQTGEQLRSQVQGGLKQNMGHMSGMMGSLQDSVSNLGRNLQSNAQGLMGHAQKAASQVTGHLQRSLSAPMNMIQNLGSSLGSMAQGAGKAATGGRY